ncbi:MAG TPA: tyrosine-type recombinase/integrase, partial [Polyangiaceae bacterium]|nr:tyrosine-type recombinase/integrase [Polyangiaceae bacterium]
MLLKPDPDRRIGHRARYVDPDTGRIVKETLNPLLTTTESREEWAVKKSKAIARRKLELDSGAPRASGTALSAAVDQYFTDHPTLRGSTRALYRGIADKLVEWASKNGVRSADDITREKLVAFKASRLRVKLQAPANGKRGSRKPAEKPRAPATINVELRATRAVLGYLRSLGLAARISTDDLRDGLARLDAPVERPECLKPAELRHLLDAALKHDAATFVATRDEHAGNGEPGSTPRYEAIAPFVAVVLLTGMRLAEALDLEWKQVDLEPPGDIRLTTSTKTHRPRDVALEVSPALRALLEALKKRTGGKGSVFGLSRGEARAALRRLIGEYEAPEFSWQTLRQTCGSYLTNAPGIFGAASAYRSAKQLGHSVAVAEKHYIGLIRGISPDAKDLETAMG